MARDRGRTLNRIAGGKIVSLLSLLSLLCLALAACGSASAGAQRAATAAPTANGATRSKNATPAPPGPPSLPYPLPATWRDAQGLSQAEAAGPVAYAFAPSNGAFGYLCASSSGIVYTTNDGGQSWNALHTAPFTGCQRISIDAQDAYDVFVQSPTAAQTNGIPDGVDLWRSRDGGATWRKLGGVTGTGFRLSWADLAVVGSQLIGQVAIDEEGSLPDYLYASSDGGYTWSPFGQSIANQGYTVSSFTALGSAIYISSMKSLGPSGMAAPIRPSANGAHAAVRPLDAPLSGQPPNPPVFWRSLDGGATWSQATLPGNTLYATPRADGHGSYALSVTTTDVSTQPQTPLDDAAIWWSADSGATWTRLPDMQGLENGYVLGGGAYWGIALAADGSVFATAQHAADGAPDDAGIFYIQPGKSAPAWQPLAAGGVQNWQANVTISGLRLWGVGTNQSDTRLKYVDVA